jgi:hypothetical protein
MTLLRFITAALALAAVQTAAAAADPLVFQGQNAALFSGANPNDTAALMTGVPKPAPPATPNLNVSQLVQESVISQISNNLYSQISGTPSGKATLGDGSSFSWSTDGGTKSIVYTAPNGAVTTITIPSL